MARIEFYEGDHERYIASVDDSAVPRSGEFVSIKKVTWKVRRVTWALDHAGEITAELRANVELEKEE